MKAIPKGFIFSPYLSLYYSLFYHNSGSRVNCLPWDDCEGTPGPFSLPNALHKVKETGLVHLHDILDKTELLGTESRSVVRI